MIIPLLENREVMHKLREHMSSRMLTESIDEAGHIFDRQYEVAEFITGVVIEAIRLNKSLVSINMERFGLHFKRAEVNITKDYAWPGVKAQYLRTDEDGVFAYHGLLNVRPPYQRMFVSLLKSYS